MKMLSTSSVLIVLFYLSACLYLGFGKDVGEESFKDCLIAKPSESLGYCLGVGTISELQTLENDPEFNIVDGVKLYRDEQQYRESYNFVESDPGNLRSVIDTIEQVFSKRNLLWDMSYVYPGLSMRLAPSFSTGGLLDFALDEHRESFNQQHLKEVGTGRLLARQYLVPLLLGLKFNMASFLPIIFGALVFFVSKVAIISKLALVISTAYALSNLVFNSGSSCAQNHYQPTLNPAFGANYDYRYKTEDYTESYLRSKNVFSDQLRIHGNIPVDEVFAKDKASGRNFAWSEDEYKKKS